MAAAALPAVAAGPVGWAIAGTIIVAVAAVAVVSAIESADETFPTTNPGPVKDCPNQPQEQPPQEQPPRPEPPRPPPVPPYVPPLWEPDSSETHPTHEEVEDATKEDSDDCGAINYAIEVLIRDLKFRRWDMQRHGGGDKAHRDAYYRRREALRRLVERARALFCPYDPEANIEMDRPHNYPTPSY